MTSLFDKIDQRVSLADVERAADDRSRIYCGIHGDEDSPDLIDYSEKDDGDDGWKCHACGESGQGVVSYVSQRDDMGLPKAAYQIIEQHELDLDMHSEYHNDEDEKKVRDCQEYVVSESEENRDKAWRHYSEETLEDLRIGWFTEDMFNQLKDRYGDILEDAGIHYGMTGDADGTWMIPHLRQNLRPNLITCRDPQPEGNSPKYQQSSGSEHVDNDQAYWATHQGSDTLVLTEGYPDAIAAYDEGFDVIAAGCGSWEGKKDLVAGYAVKNYNTVFVASDNDDTGLENLQEIAAEVADKDRKYTATVKVHDWDADKPEGYDLDDWCRDNKGELQELIDNSPTFFDKFRNYKPSDIGATMVKDRVTVRGVVKGRKGGMALPESVTASCQSCGAEAELDLDNKRFQRRLLTSRKNQHNLIQSKLKGCGPDDCSGNNNNHSWYHNIDSYIDKRWIMLQDSIEDTDQFEQGDDDKLPVYVLDTDIPGKDVKVTGQIEVDAQDDTVFMNADRVEPKDDAVVEIDFDEDDHAEYLEDWERQKAEKMVDPGMVGRSKSRTALQLLAHSPVRIPDVEGDVMRGALRVAFVGDGGTNKSEQAKKLTKNGHGLGAFATAEAGSRAGLLYNVNTDRNIIEWGALPLSDKSLLCIDGFNEMSSSTVTEFREVMEDQEVRVNMSVQGSAPARTRILACMNPDPTPVAHHYDNMAEALEEMDQFQGPDYRRWSLFVGFQDGDVSQEAIANREKGDKPYSDHFYQRHVKWAWNLEPSDIHYTDGFTHEVKVQSSNIMRSYKHGELKIVSSGFRAKLTRLSVAWAVLEHSMTEDLDVKVTSRHVKEAAAFFRDVVNDLGLNEQIEEYEERTTVDDDEAEELLEDLEAEQLDILAAVAENGPLSSGELGSELDMSKRTVKKKWSDLKSQDLLSTSSGQGARVTPRGRQLKDHEDFTKFTLSWGVEGGGSPGRLSDYEEDSEENSENQGKVPPHPPTGGENVRESVKNVKGGDDNSDSPLSETEQEVLDYLSAVEGEDTPGQVRIANDKDLAADDVSDALQSLKDQGAVEKTGTGWGVTQ
jgi:hypothetical protein